MFLAPTVSSLRYNRAEREVSGRVITRPVPMAGLSKEAVNTGSGDKLRQKVDGGFRQSCREHMGFSFRWLRRPIQTHRRRVGEGADQSSGVEASIPLSDAHLASEP